MDEEPHLLQMGLTNEIALVQRNRQLQSTMPKWRDLADQWRANLQRISTAAQSTGFVRLCSSVFRASLWTNEGPERKPLDERRKIMAPGIVAKSLLVWLSILVLVNRRFVKLSLFDHQSFVPVNISLKNRFTC